MCLGIPGQITELEPGDNPLRSGKVRFGNITKTINLGFVPEAGINDYVIVHAGVAISIMNEFEAEKIIASLEQLDISP